MINQPEILVIGGGIIGLSIAIELKLRGANVNIVDQHLAGWATPAAAGMLAPQAEQIEPGAMLDLCCASRDIYADYASKLEHITGANTGYWPCGILAPVYQADDQVINHDWLNQDAIQQKQPGLGAEVQGGYWYPLDGQVDNRLLFQSLQRAIADLDIPIHNTLVKNIIFDGAEISYLATDLGELKAEHYVLAMGSWSQELLSIPVFPTKGQMLSVILPEIQTDQLDWQLQVIDNLPLQQVLFGENSYIVPRKNGRIVIGATTEKVGFAPGNTGAGMQTLLNNAIKLFPLIKECQIEEFWWGFRPATPDQLPILGTSAYNNLTLATGHYRNGILLGPITAQLIADLVWDNKSHPLLDSFHYSRFS
jgi:glycine oxidase ThiO